MPPLGMALRWKTGDEEKGDAIAVSSGVPVDTSRQISKNISHASRRSIDPASAIPIEYRSLYEPLSSFL